MSSERRLRCSLSHAQEAGMRTRNADCTDKKHNGFLLSMHPFRAFHAGCGWLAYLGLTDFAVCPVLHGYHATQMTFQE